MGEVRKLGLPKLSLRRLDVSKTWGETNASDYLKNHTFQLQNQAWCSTRKSFARTLNRMAAEDLFGGVVFVSLIACKLGVLYEGGCTQWEANIWKWNGFFTQSMEPEMGFTHQPQDKTYEILGELVGCQDNLFRCLNRSVFALELFEAWSEQYRTAQ